MCVVLLVQDKRPSPEMVAACFRQNSAGGGAAWRARVKPKGAKEAITVVQWEKGLDLMRMQELAETLPIPYVLHFRIPTNGGALKSLCHPFEVSEGASNALSGMTRNGVLFHNGHYQPWKEKVVEVATRMGVKIPGGTWSDTRAMAWLTHHLGRGFIEFTGEKLCLFTPEDIELANTSAWDKEDTIWVSNKQWKHLLSNRPVTSPYTTPPASMAGGPKELGPAPADQEEHTDPQPGSVSAEASGNTQEAVMTRVMGGRVLPFAKGRGAQVTPPSGRYTHPETGEVVSKKQLKRWVKKQEWIAQKGATKEDRQMAEALLQAYHHRLTTHQSVH